MWPSLSDHGIVKGVADLRKYVGETMLEMKEEMKETMLVLEKTRLGLEETGRKANICMRWILGAGLGIVCCTEILP